MEEQEFLIVQTKQIAVKAINHDEAFKKVLSGEGTVAALNMSANPRPQQTAVASGVQTRMLPTKTITQTTP